MSEHSIDNSDYEILIIDPNQKDSLNLKYILDGLYRTHLVHNGKEALDYIKEFSPDVVISEVEVPDINGIEICEAIKTDESKVINEIPIIYLTNIEDSILKAKLFEKGASDYVQKPYDILELFSRIEILIERINKKRELYEDIDKLVEDKKLRTKNIMDSRKSIYNKYKLEINKYQSDIDKLTNLLIEKDEKLRKCNEVEELNKLLEKEVEVLKEKLELIKEPENPNSEQDSQKIKEFKEYFLKLEKQYQFASKGIKQIVNIILARDISFEKVDNLFFINNIVLLIRKRTKEKINSFEDLEDEIKNKIDALTDFIIKKYLDDFLYHFAVNLLDLVSLKNKQAIKFLQFYDGKMEITRNGVKFKKPVIQSENGDIWNMITIVQVLGQRKQSNDFMRKQEQAVVIAKKKLDTMHKQLQHFLSDFNSIDNEELKKERTFEEKLEFAKELIDEKREQETDPKEKENINMLSIKIDNIAHLANKFSSSIKQETSKIKKLEEYYKPANSKFHMLAVAVSKNLLKIKIIER
jgi:DNA-binding response OmpR family regulator